MVTRAVHTMSENLWPLVKPWSKVELAETPLAENHRPWRLSNFWSLFLIVEDESSFDKSGCGTVFCSHVNPIMVEIHSEIMNVRSIDSSFPSSWSNLQSLPSKYSDVTQHSVSSIEIVVHCFALPSSRRSYQEIILPWIPNFYFLHIN